MPGISVWRCRRRPVTFILNADLHVIGRGVLPRSNAALNELPDAAVVGPQGSFFDFATAQDIQYFQRGSFSAPINVDAVSGFLFGVRTNAFGPGGLQFENSFTPCYFEEWDLGLQCRLMGVKCYIVPTTGYDHEWSGSIRALRTIKYFRSEATSREILDRNRVLFLEKWKRIARTAGRPGSWIRSGPTTMPRSRRRRPAPGQDREENHDNRADIFAPACPVRREV